MWPGVTSWFRLFAAADWPEGAVDKSWTARKGNQGEIFQKLPFPGGPTPRPRDTVQVRYRHGTGTGPYCPVFLVVVPARTIGLEPRTKPSSGPPLPEARRTGSYPGLRSCLFFVDALLPPGTLLEQSESRIAAGMRCIGT